MTEFLRRVSSTDIRNILSILATLCCFGLLAALVFKPIPEANKDLLNTAIGLVIGATLSAVYGYYFGASKGNKSDPH